MYICKRIHEYGYGYAYIYINAKIQFSLNEKAFMPWVMMLHQKSRKLRCQSCYLSSKY